MANDTVEVIEVSDDSGSSTDGDSEIDSDNNTDIGYSRINDEADDVRAHAALKREIKALIKPHKDSKQKPPFSAEDLIVIALICGELREQHSSYEILREICLGFRHYERKMLKFIFRRAGHWGTIEVDSYDDTSFYDEVLGGFEKAISSTRLPLIAEPDGVSDWYSERFDSFEYSISPSAARIFLEPWLCEPRQGTFLFFELPAELRNTIYEMVLVLPRPGLRVTGNEMKRIQWAEGEDLDMADYIVNRGISWNMGSLTALLHVCKQTRSEAAPIFYGLNLFCFPCNTDLGFILNHQARMVTKNLRQVYIYLSPTDGFADAVQGLGSLEKLKLLIISTDEYSWLRMSPGDRWELFQRKTNFTKIDCIPGFRDLARVAAKVDKFELRGDCPKIQQFFDTEIEKIKTNANKNVSKKASRKMKGKAVSKDAVNGGGGT